MELGEDIADSRVAWLLEAYRGLDVGVAVYRAIPECRDFTFVAFNEAGQTIERTRGEEVLGRRLREVFPAVDEFGLIDVLCRVLETGQSEELAVRNYDDGQVVGWRRNHVMRLGPDLVAALYEDLSEQMESELALRERIKELTGVYAIQRDLQRELPLSDLLARAVEHLRVAMQFPHFALPAITLDGATYGACPETHSGGELRAPIIVKGEHRGTVRVAHVEDRPFLIPYEPNLLAGIAAELALAVERTESREQLLRNQRELRRAAKVFASTADGVVITDLEGTILDVNAAFATITGYPRDEIIGKNPSHLASGRHPREYYEELWNTLRCEGHWRGEIWNRRKGGEVYAERLSISTVYDDDGTPSGYVGVFTDITASKQAEAELDHLAHHDALTGLPNRLLLKARLDQSLDSARRSQRKLAVMFIDVDRFKQVNDSLGHAAGDVLLQEIARRLGGLVRQEDTVARISGDEFVVLAQNVAGPDAARRVAEKVMEAFAPAFLLAEREVHVGCSVGVAIYPDDGLDAATVLRNADTAMYWAKEEGRNDFRFYAREMSEEVNAQLALETALHHALADDELRLVYQPHFDLETGAVRGVEALLRWDHPTQGRLLPERFLPLAEETGLVVPIGEHALAEACRQAREWEDAGLEFGSIAVNVNPQLLRDAGFLSYVCRTLAETDLSPERLVLEVNEEALMSSPAEFRAQLARLGALGVAVTVDGFGTGYSSLRHLRCLPISKLKIDRSFVANVPGDAHDIAITDAVIALGRALELEIVAEGIETKAQAEFLRARGCAQAQGPLLATPRTPEAITDLLRETSAAGEAAE